MSEKSKFKKISTKIKDKGKIYKYDVDKSIKSKGVLGILSTKYKIP